MTTVQDPEWVHHLPDSGNHATRHDREYGLSTVCGISGAGRGYQDPTGPVDCGGCRATGIVDGVHRTCREVAGRAPDARVPANAVLLVGLETLAVLLRWPEWERHGGPRALFGVPVVEAPDTASVIRWRLDQKGTTLAEGVLCPECARPINHPEDLRGNYCAACHWWTVDPNLLAAWRGARQAARIQTPAG